MLHIIVILSLLTVFSAANGQQASVPNTVSRGITILADYSLTAPLNELARDYALRHSISVTTNFGSTYEQIADIEAGEEANILIASKASWVAELQQKGLIDVYSRAPVARNRMVLSASPFARLLHALHTNSVAQDFTPNIADFQLALGDAQYNAEGSYAMEILGYYRLTSEMEPYYSFFRNHYAMIDAQRDQDSYGVMFLTDAQLFPQVRIMQRFPPESHSPVTYQAVVVAGEQMDEARIFVKYLQGDKAKTVFAKYGFGAVY